MACRSCQHRIRDTVVKFTKGDLVKLSKSFKLSAAAHGNLVAQKRELWGVIECFTQPATRSQYLDPSGAADRCVCFPPDRNAPDMED